MKGFRNKNLSFIIFLFYLKDEKAFTQNCICVFLTGEHMELYTKNFHELPGAEIELRGNIVLLKFIIALSVSYYKPPKILTERKTVYLCFQKH